jgi:hypothetical protein
VRAIVAIKRKPFMAEIVRVLQSEGFPIDDKDTIYAVTIDGTIVEVSLDHRGLNTRYRAALL